MSILFVLVPLAVLAALFIVRIERHRQLLQDVNDFELEFETEFERLRADFE